MFFKHNEQSLADDKGSKLADENLGQLDYDSHLTAVAVVSSSRGVSEESSSGGPNNLNIDKENATTLALNADFPHGNTSSSPVMGNITDGIFAEQSKRPLCDDEVYLISCKRPKQIDQNLHLDPYAETQFRASVPPSSGLVVATNDLKKNKADGPMNLPNKVTGCSQFTSSHCDEETVLESPVDLHSLYGCFEKYHQAVGFCPTDEFFSPVCDYYPRKPVAIGTNHQADVPEWSSHSRKKIGYSSYCAPPLVPSTDCHLANEDDIEKWIGSCIIPMPDSSSLGSEIRVVLHKTDCTCVDVGSVSCIRQHVNEAREELKKILGQDKFDQLGLYDMGEGVADKWTAEEEHLFQEVVSSNPASLGKNFWDALPYFFPDRSCKELVSYYFNVFMLRKRAEQNRFDPLNIDSDNDEWQGSDDEFAVEEENEEDSVVESLADQDAVTCDKVDHEDVEMNEDTEDGDECYDYATAGEKEGGFYGVSEGYNMDNPNFLPPVEYIDKNLQNSVVEQDVQDESCTSYEGQHGADSCGLADVVDTQHGLIDDHDNLHRDCKNDGLSGLSNQEFFHGH